ncbi:TPA: hypothetical protein N0F65_007199 [Lagenidium giganteum]|uniref:AMP-dependent synthetase/ligase domain-containing protein n=1 Tax=Lagenidium giganteum TaxID=4803 RepID=A0AAV2Z971_9STRA|nr:TPA: hypothetical protein N0F65_007199 [Lagenidium giganteum]
MTLTFGIRNGQLMLVTPLDGSADDATIQASVEIIRGGLKASCLPHGLELYRRAGILPRSAFVLVLSNDRTSVACLLAAMAMQCVCVLVGANRVALLEHVQQQTGLRTVVTVKHAEDCVHVVSNASDDEAPLMPWASDPAIADDGCVCILTSGTVGDPKIVVSTWESMRLQGQCTQQELFPDKPARVTCETSISHAYSINAVFALYMSKVDQDCELCFTNSTAALYEHLVERTDKISILFGTPATLTVLCALPPKKLYVDVPFCAGSRLAVQLFNQVRDRFGIQPMQNYGSSETGCICAWGLFQRSNEQEAAMMATEASLSYVGYAWPGVQVSIDDATNEIRVRTPWHSLGYVSEKQLQANDGGFHHTADTGTLRADDSGSVRSCGAVWVGSRIRAPLRIQTSSDVREVSPSTLEALLTQDHSEITDALAILPRNPSTMSACRVRVVLRDPQSSQSPASIAEWCSAKLGVPVNCIEVELVKQLPCSPAGKLIYN